MLSNDDIRRLMPGNNLELDTSKIRDIAGEVLDADGRIKVLPASYWASTTVQERAAFGHRQGIYCFPTVELVDRLREIIAGREAIEIGAGHGVLAQALDIPATDNFQQNMPKYKLIYLATKQPTVPYGSNVIDMHASRAVRAFKPDVVIGAWITHKADPREPQRGGNEIGVDQPDVLANCAQFVLIGNEKTQEQNPIWAREHAIEYPDYVYSRAHNGSREFIAIFPGNKR